MFKACAEVDHLSEKSAGNQRREPLRHLPSDSQEAAGAVCQRPALRSRSHGDRKSEGVDAEAVGGMVVRRNFADRNRDENPLSNRL